MTYNSRGNPLQFHPPIPSLASIEEATWKRFERQLEELLGKYQGANRAYVEAVLREITSKYSYQTVLMAPKDGIYYDSENDTLVFHLQFYNQKSQYHQGFLRGPDQDMVTWIGKDGIVNDVWPPLREMFLQDLLQAVGENGRKIQGASANVTVKVDFSAFTITQDHGTIVSSPRWPHFEIETVRGGSVGNVWNYTATLDLVTDPKEPTGVRELSRETRFIDRH